MAFHALAVGGILAFEIFKSDPPPVSQAIAPVESPSDQVYVIQKGDTIYGVARRFGASPEQLLRYNAIADPESITIGTQVRIPKAGEAVERD
ncbi:MAG: LysM peptidoglycan-binding domain-containing protein [Verrucomicrobiales bacterium]|nr:LysM peptidoglycan-binding domain-containing protein [Verrucomicrobiae bacterium]